MLLNGYIHSDATFMQKSQTACFAGPVFNILIGMSFGFSSLAVETGNPEMSVTLTPSIAIGFFFIIINTLMLATVGSCFNPGQIPKRFGYVMISLYTVYVILSILLQFSKYRDDR
jgi:Ca2+/Na+ antiporter